jgi:glycosyltransferase involved in cell wall biosynthesis
VNPEDVDSIAGGMRRVLDDGALRNEMVAAGRQRSREFTWRRCATETLRVFERIRPEAGPVSGPANGLVGAAFPKP